MRRKATVLLVIIAIILIIPLTSGQRPAGHTWWVDSSRGSDSTGTGDEAKPFKTITHALSRASEWDTVKVKAASPYDTANGETFPIKLKRNVILMGVSTYTLDAKVMPLIKGGGSYVIPSSSRYVSVLAADGTSISGFLFQALNSGAGVSDAASILCNSTSPTIEDNRFTGSGNAHSGIALLGTAHPTIRNNQFESSGLVWGITAYGYSNPQIQNNRFTGSNGIDCSDHSHPLIEGNFVSTQGAGISTKGWSAATITDNTIFKNRDYGIIVRMDSTPAIQDNRITSNPVGIYLGEGNPVPVIGGGSSSGNNTFNNTAWNIESHSNASISARNNHWPSVCCEDIDAKIYDDDESPLSGKVDIGMCVVCRARSSLSRPLGK